MRPNFLHNDANYGVNFLNTTIHVSVLSADCAWFVSRLYHTFIARTNPKTLRGIARALSESALQFIILDPDLLQCERRQTHAMALLYEAVFRLQAGPTNENIDQ